MEDLPPRLVGRIIGFCDQELTVDDFLALVLSGMQLSHRTVPCYGVDVVTVQSYDLIELLGQPFMSNATWTGPRNVSRDRRIPRCSVKRKRDTIFNEATPRSEQSSRCGDPMKIQENSMLCAVSVTQCSDRMVLSRPPACQ